MLCFFCYLRRSCHDELQLIFRRFFVLAEIPKKYSLKFWDFFQVWTNRTSLTVSPGSWAPAHCPAQQQTLPCCIQGWFGWHWHWGLGQFSYAKLSPHEVPQRLKLSFETLLKRQFFHPAPWIFHSRSQCVPIFNELAPRPIQSITCKVCVIKKMSPPSTTGTERARDFWSKSYR